MFDPVRSDTAINVSRLALDGLALRQDVVSDNIANVDTPGYKAKEVNFEATLKRAMQGASSPELPLSLTHPRHIDVEGSGVLYHVTQNTSGTPRADGNNVNIDNEFVQMNENGVRQTAITQLVARKLRIIKDITRIR